MKILPKQKANYITYGLLLLLVIADRWILLDQFTFQYVDDDQSIMWYGAKEFGTGHFREPCFFGQSYNTMVESLFAVPLIKAGISYPVALTVIMSLFTLLPYLIFSWLLLKQEKALHAFIVLSIPLLLPVEFGMITAISRGLMTGILFAAIALLTLFKKFRGQFVVFGFFGILALFANPAALILLFPAGLWVLAENFRNHRFYLQAIAGAVPAATIWIFAIAFYRFHPEYVVHANWNLGFLLKVIKPYEWDKFFNYVTPVFWNLGWLIFPLLLFIGIVLVRQNRKYAGYSLFAGVVLLFFSLTLFNVHNGYPTVFLSWARMFLAIPLLIGVFTSFIHFSPKVVRFAPLVLIVAAAFFIIKCSSTKAIVHREVIEKTEHAMHVTSIDSLQTLCDTIYAVARQNSAELIIVGSHYTKHLVNYGCPCLREDLPLILEPELDRRTWLLDEEDERIRTNVLFVGIYGNLLPASFLNHPDVTIVSEQPLMMLLKNNTLSSGEMLEAIGFPMRPH